MIRINYWKSTKLNAKIPLLLHVSSWFLLSKTPGRKIISLSRKRIVICVNKALNRDVGKTESLLSSRDKMSPRNKGVIIDQFLHRKQDRVPCPNNLTLFLKEPGYTELSWRLLSWGQVVLMLGMEWVLPSSQFWWYFFPCTFFLLHENRST